MSDQETRVTVADGKYTVVHANGIGLRALRYGAPWRNLVGDGLVLALVHRIEELEAERTETALAPITARMLHEAKAHLPCAVSKEGRAAELEWTANYLNEAMKDPNKPCECCGCTPNGDIVGPASEEKNPWDRSQGK